MLEEHDEPVGDIDHIEKDHEEADEHLVVMGVSSQPIWAAEVVVHDNVEEDGDDDEVEGLEEIDFVHGGDDAFRFCLVLLEADAHVKKHPDQLLPQHDHHDNDDGSLCEKGKVLLYLDP